VAGGVVVVPEAVEDQALGARRGASGAKRAKPAGLSAAMTARVALSVTRSAVRWGCSARPTPGSV